MEFELSNIENLKDLIIYQSQNNENISVEVLYSEEDFWLTQKSMSELFGVEVNTINYHLKEIFKTEELQEESVIRKIRITANTIIKNTGNTIKISISLSLYYTYYTTKLQKIQDCYFQSKCVI